MNPNPERMRRVGILGGMGPAATLGYEWIAPDEACQAAFVDPAIAAVKAADRDRARERFGGAASHLAGRGADLLLLGCTELPLASTGTGTGTDFEPRCLDANLALAQAIVRFALGAGAAPAPRSA